uniref:Reverse transcriptase domain-containing protein n=1 Tax=Tanacetum cinerariifolium TaxID=118510 RepID=A0A6L2KUE9_TANCI|nr:reverse transcriptase domain-containing protein [Tanacetum cinerariifolium]
MLERLVENKFFCFLDGFSIYFQIPIEPADQENTTFTSPYGTYAYKRMAFGLCNVPATFQRFMIRIFQDMLETSMEVFMDDFSVFRDSFNSCLNNLEQMLIRCKQAHLVLNWEKCHFMVTEGIVLGHKVSRKGLEAEAEALPTNDAWVVVNFLKKIFTRFGIPKALIGDRGTHFCNRQMEKILKKYGVHQRIATDYHPQTNGQVENTNIALKRILEKTVKDNPSIWSRNLDDALWAFRTAYKTPIGTNPYRLLYGKTCHLPSEIEHHAYWALRSCNPDLKVAGEKRFLQLHELDELRHQAYENSKLYKARTKAYHDKKLRVRKEFKVVDKVLLYKFKYKFIAPNLRSKWYGPFIVKHDYPSEYVELYDKHGGSFIVNGHSVKLYHDEEYLNELTIEEIHLMFEEGNMKAIPFMAPFPANYRETMPWASEKPYI